MRRPHQPTIPWSHGAGAENAYSAGQLGQVVREAEKVGQRGGGHLSVVKQMEREMMAQASTV